ncbi:MAG: Spy/CpxP family protein refolding chaperone [Rhodopila sp.]|nr:Spy/CpxP family protein refolding chaperone [Rhodopila sp.]
MTKISKGLAAAVAAAIIGGGSLIAVAQAAGPGYGPGYGPMGFMQGRGGPGMMGGWGGAGYMRGPGGPASFDPSARLDTLKTELGIRADQAVAWDAYAKAVKDSATQMQETRNSVDFGALRAMSWQEHQAYMGKLWDKRAEAFKTVQAAATKLMASLDDTQKAHALLPGLLAGPGMMGPGMMGPGMGPWGPSGPR